MLEDVLGRKYPKWKDDEGATFLIDLLEMIRGGKLAYKGMGTLNKPQGPV